MITGSAAHKLILEGQEEFDKCYVYGGPVNPKTGNEYGRETKAYQEWELQQRQEHGNDVTFLSTDQYSQVQQMQISVHSHEQAMNLLREGQAEQVIRTNYCGVACQSRYDWIDKSCITDLKTCQNLDNFQSDAMKYGYGIQFTFYAMILEQAVGQSFKIVIDMPDVYVIAVEKNFPYRTGVFFFAPVNYDFFVPKIVKAFNNYKKCLETGQFPTMFQKVLTLNLTN
jgi:hypothetical protein